MSLLKDRRKALDLTQAQLAEASGVNLRLLQDYEQGRRDLSLAAAISVCRLAKALNCTAEDLLDLTDINSTINRGTR